MFGYILQFAKLRKGLGNKKNEITAEDRSAVTKIYADFVEGEYCKIYKNEEFIYREFVVMQPLQRSYAITTERIENLATSGALNNLYDEVKVIELENYSELTGKELKKLETFQNNKSIYYGIFQSLTNNACDKIFNSLDSFLPYLTEVLSDVTTDKKLIDKIADGLSIMDKNAEVQKDRKGNILYDKDTKNIELVKCDETIDEYMARVVWPHTEDAVAFFEENISAKKPVIKTGAEIPFTRYFYKYQEPQSSEELSEKFMELEKSINQRISNLFK